jgi:hypothetical protein
LYTSHSHNPRSATRALSSPPLLHTVLIPSPLAKRKKWEDISVAAFHLSCFYVASATFPSLTLEKLVSNCLLPFPDSKAALETCGIYAGFFGIVGTFLLREDVGRRTPVKYFDFNHFLYTNPAFAITLFPNSFLYYKIWLPPSRNGIGQSQLRRMRRRRSKCAPNDKAQVQLRYGRLLLCRGGRGLWSNIARSHPLSWHVRAPPLSGRTASPAKSRRLVFLAPSQITNRNPPASRDDPTIGIHDLQRPPLARCVALRRPPGR